MALVALHNGLMVGGYSHPLIFWDRIRLTADYTFYINRLGEQTLFFFTVVRSKPIIQLRVRHPLVQKIVQAYDEYEKKAKPENHSGRAKSTTRKRRENK